jgi:FAD/FMN-containing dehydrogenase
MQAKTTITGFSGEVVLPGDDAYDTHREVWNAIVDRRPAVIARCTSSDDVAAAIRFGREANLEIAVKCGGHSMLGLSVPGGGLMIDLTPMSAVRVDPTTRRAYVQGGSLLRNLDRAAEPFGLATTAGNVSHTGVGGLTLGGGMGWLARQFGLACDNVAAYTVVTADGETVRASADENPDLFWGLRGGGGNFGVVTEFEFRLHPITGRALLVDLWFEPLEAVAALRVWRELLVDAPRQAMLTSGAVTGGDAPFLPTNLRGRPLVTVGYIWVGDMDEGRAYLPTIREVGQPVAEAVEEMSYVELQSISDANHYHGKRRYSKGHYLTELTDAAIAAFVGRGVADGAEPDWSRIPSGEFQAHGGAIADIAYDEAAFAHRDTLVEWGSGLGWLDPGEDEERIAAARAYGAALEPFASGIYVNMIAEEGQAGVRRAYDDDKLIELRQLKRRFDPDNVFHLNHNIQPADALVAR